MTLQCIKRFKLCFVHHAARELFAVVECNSKVLAVTLLKFVRLIKMNGI